MLLCSLRYEAFCILFQILVIRIIGNSLAVCPSEKVVGRLVAYGFLLLFHALVDSPQAISEFRLNENVPDRIFGLGRAFPVVVYVLSFRYMDIHVVYVGQVKADGLPDSAAGQGEKFGEQGPTLNTHSFY